MTVERWGSRQWQRALSFLQSRCLPTPSRSLHRMVWRARCSDRRNARPVYSTPSLAYEPSAGRNATRLAVPLWSLDVRSWVGPWHLLLLGIFVSIWWLSQGLHLVSLPHLFEASQLRFAVWCGPFIHCFTHGMMNNQIQNELPTLPGIHVALI